MHCHHWYSSLSDLWPPEKSIIFRVETINTDTNVMLLQSVADNGFDYEIAQECVSEVENVLGQM